MLIALERCAIVVCTIVHRLKRLCIQYCVHILTNINEYVPDTKAVRLGPLLPSDVTIHLRPMMTCFKLCKQCASIATTCVANLLSMKTSMRKQNLW